MRFALGLWGFPLEAYCAKVVYCWSGHLTTTQVVVSWPLQKHWSKAIYTILGSTYHPQISLLPRFFTILCLVQSALTGTSSVPIRISDGNSHPTRELFSDRWLNKARPRYSMKVTPAFLHVQTQLVDNAHLKVDHDCNHHLATIKSKYLIFINYHY